MGREYIPAIIFIAILFVCGQLYRLYQKWSQKKQAEKEEQRKLNSALDENGEEVAKKEEHWLIFRIKRLSKGFLKVLTIPAVILGATYLNRCSDDIKYEDKFKGLEGKWFNTFEDTEAKNEASPEERELYTFEYKETIIFKGAEIEKKEGCFLQQGTFEDIIIPVGENCVGYSVSGEYGIIWPRSTRTVSLPGRRNNQPIRQQADPVLVFKYYTEKIETSDGEIIERVKLTPVVEGIVSSEEIEEQMNLYREEYTKSEDEESFAEFYDISLMDDDLRIGNQPYTRVK